MHTEPQKEHQWLQQLVGEWTYEADCNMGPDQPRQKMKGTERVRSLGGLWTIAEGRGEMPGGATGDMIMTLGYDTQQKRYVGSWVGSMMTNMWVYAGSVDAAGKVLTLDTEGPDCYGGGGTTRYQDIIEIKGPDQRTLTSRSLGKDGTWSEIMTAHYRRTK